jgi:hypothetical protein
MSIQVAEHSNADWQRITNRKGWRRCHPPYWSARYDGGYLVIATGELPGGEAVTAEAAMQRGLDWLASMRPDVRMPNGSIKTHERLCRPSPSWPEPDRDYRISQFKMVGLVPAQKEEILNSLNSWRFVRPGLARSMAVTEWQQLPQGFRWFIEYHLHVLSPWEILVLFRGMGLRPRRGETEEEMERRIYSLFETIAKAA